MIVVTGAAGFIGSCMVGKLNREGYNDLVVVDDFSRADKAPNLAGKTFTHMVERAQFVDWLDANEERVQFIIHLGARTDTTESDEAIFDALNLNYSKAIWQRCVRYGLPLIYASSAATYGLGEHGYDDNHEVVSKLTPLNAYGRSKNDFDTWALSQEEQPYFWAGFKFFNVYGPNEYHKGRMASVIFHASRQIRATHAMKLFASHRDDYKDGEQQRDFVYIKDVVEVLLHFMESRKQSGLYNLGTGEARTFYDLADNTFKALGQDTDISFIPTPEDIRDKYQYFTEANMQKLREAGYDKPFHSLEAGIEDYVKNYLISETYY
ncbi:MAG: ADP-glyceromanno-heptose 6-epimerase [Salibacteraceae bacterium]